eukprot:m.138342 g.138342  ORF g.138342 m.138342 type:complete len:59 (-) comp17027_c0_seq4:262-438(-)
MRRVQGLQVHKDWRRRLREPVVVPLQRQLQQLAGEAVRKDWEQTQAGDDHVLWAVVAC